MGKYKRIILLGIIFALLFIETAGCEQPEYWKNKIHIEEVWKETYGNENIIVGIVDSGIDITSADLQSVTRTIVRRMDWSRLDDSPPFGRIVWRVEEPRWNYRHGQIRTRWNRHLPGNTDYCPSLPWPSAQACQRTYTAKKSG